MSDARAEQLSKVDEMAESLGLGPMSSWYEASGGDTSVCEICGGPLDESETWMRGLDGAGAHTDCVQAWLQDDDVD